MDSKRFVLALILWLGAVLETWLVVAYLLLLNLRGRIGRQLLLVALVGACEKITLSLLLFGMHVHMLVFMIGYAASDVVSARWLLLLYWARRGAPRHKGVIRLGLYKIAKAIAAGLSSGVGMFWTLHADKMMTSDDWTVVAVTTIGVGVLTWLVPNAPETPATPSVADLETARLEPLKR